MRFTPNEPEELMQVIIEVDPHKASHTAVAIDSNEDRLDWYKQLERDPIHSSIEFVVTDRIFTQARATEGQLHGYGQAWALTHFLMERHFDKLMNWYILVGQRRQRERLTPEQLLSSFRFVFGDLRLLEQEWRLYMRGLQTDVERVLKGN